MLRLQTLRNPCLTIDGANQSFGPKKNLACLAYLACQPLRTARRRELATLLWPEVAPDRSRRSLNQAVYDLRSRFPTLEIKGTSDVLALNPATIQVDIWELQRALDSGNVLLCVDLVPGPFLWDFAIGSTQFEQWRDGWWTSMTMLLSRRANLAAAEALAAGRWAEGKALSRFVTTLDPLNADAARLHVEATALAGDIVAARNFAETFRAEWLESIGEDLPASVLGSFRGVLQSNPQLGPQHPIQRPPSFVGREKEFGLLLQAWESACTGKEGGLVVISGRAGIGKTRLCVEFGRLVAIRGGRVLHGNCYAAESKVPFSPIVDIFQDHLALADLDGLAQPWYSLFQNHFMAAADGSGPQVTEISLDPDTSQKRLHETVARFFQLLMSRGPVLLFLDDVHWADEASLALLHFLVRRLYSGPILMILTLRPEEPTKAARTVSGWRIPDGGNGPVTLGELDEKTTIDLVRDYGQRLDITLHEGFPDWVYDKTNGHPYFVVELVRSKIIGQSSFSSWPAEKTNDGVPHALEEHIRSRLALLDRAALRCLEALAVVGGRAMHRLLQEVALQNTSAFVDGLKALHVAGFIDEHEGEVRLTHGIMRDVVYRSIPSCMRRLMHETAAVALRQENARPGRVALHFDFAGNRECAYATALEAAEEALSANAFEEAETFYRMALATASSEEARVAIREDLVSMFLRRGSYSNASHILEALAEDYRLQGKSRKGIWTAVQQTRVNAARGALSPDQAITALSAQARAAEIEGDRAIVLSALISMGIWSHHALLSQSAVEVAQRLLNADFGNGDVEELGLVGMSLGLLLLAAFHSVKEALQLANVKLPGRDSIADPVAKSIVSRCRGQISFQNGDLKQAERDFTDLIALNQKLGIGPSWQGVNNNVAVLEIEKGNYDKALALLDDNRRFALDREKNDDLIFVYFNIASIYYECGAFAEAVNVSHLWVEVLNRLSISSRLHEPWSMLGLVALEQGNYSEANRWRREILYAEHGQPLWYGDTSYRERFLARMARLDGGSKEAIARLRAGLVAYTDRDFFCRARIALELCCLLIDTQSEEAACLADEVRTYAAKVGAKQLVVKADAILDRVEYKSTDFTKTVIT